MKKNPPKVLLIDDEEDGRNIIRLLLHQLFPLLEIAGVADSVASGVEQMELLQPDIVFLDIELKDGCGFDVLAAAGCSPAQIIVTTAHDHYALKALKVSVLDFILKPINREEFRLAVEKALKHTAGPQRYDRESLLEFFQQKLLIRKIKIPMLHGFALVDVDTILHCEACGSYTVMHFADGTARTICRGLSEYESELAPFGFSRIHHKYLINVKLVTEYRKGKIGGGYVIMQDGTQLEVSVRKRGSWSRLLDAGTLSL